MPKGDFLGAFEEIVLLALIHLRDNAYGMTIRREIEDRSGRTVSIGAVYSTLDRLEAPKHAAGERSATSSSNRKAPRA